MTNPHLNTLLKTVVAGGYCIGCGSCASVSGSPIRIEFDEFKRYRPVVDPTAEGDAGVDVTAVCPFSGSAPDEDAIAREHADVRARHHPKIGYYLAAYGGHVVEGGYRERGSSGGMGTWMADEMLRRGLIDAVIHVKPSAGDEALYVFQISRTSDEVRGRAKSAYYPVEISRVMAQVREQPGRYLFIGVPCFVKAVRLLCRSDAVLRERIKYCIGLICGHLKSARYVDFLAWQCGIEPGGLTRADFRTKKEGTTASTYFNTFIGKSGTEPVERQSSTFFGGSWGYGLFMYSACEFCDDVVAETADLTIGDAWLPRYVKDWRGDNVMVTRNAEIEAIICEGRAEGRLELDVLTAEDVVTAQAGCFRQRHEGLAYRLYLKDQAGEWRPPKRIQPGWRHIGARLRRKYHMRSELTSTSHRSFGAAVRSGKMETFRAEMIPLMNAYDKVDRPWWRRFLSRCKQQVKRMLIGRVR